MTETATGTTSATTIFPLQIWNARKGREKKKPRRRPATSSPSADAPRPRARASGSTKPRMVGEGQAHLAWRDAGEARHVWREQGNEGQDGSGQHKVAALPQLAPRDREEAVHSPPPFVPHTARKISSRVRPTTSSERSTRLASRASSRFSSKSETMAS